MTLKLNIGAGDTQIEGFTPVDRKFGQDAYPLDYDDDSVDEIRASHILEHFGWGEVSQVLTDWVRVLKPKGRIKIAVPNARAIMNSSDQRWKHFLMGGQTHADDFHRSCWDESSLRALMANCGLAGLNRWESDNTDTASLPISLNLEGIKPDEWVPQVRTAQPVEKKMVRIAPQMTVPRYGSCMSLAFIFNAMSDNGLRLFPTQGVFWHECMECDFEAAIEDGAEWILTVDSDSMITAGHIRMLLDAFRGSGKDALCSIQAKRADELAIGAVADEVEEIDPDQSVIPAKVAHFGLTLLKSEALLRTPKPWFHAVPGYASDWNMGKRQADVAFWQKWIAAGNTIGFLKECEIGHLEEVVAMIGSGQHKYVDLNTWITENMGGETSEA